jgi:hemerythrin-like domain-containing protein
MTIQPGFGGTDFAPRQTTEGIMKATALLKKQHRRVERIFENLEKGSADPASELLELANNLAAHMAIEQNLFYPAARDIDGRLVAQSYEEHAIAELALKRVLTTAGDDPTFAPKVTALKELIERHVAEEEKQLFPEVEDKMDAEELDALGNEMSAAFEEAVAEGYESLLPEGIEASADGARQSPIATRPERTRKHGAKKHGTAPHSH